MKSISQIALIVLLAAVSLSLTSETFAQTTVPKEEVPSDIPAEVRNEILGLYSSNLVDRGNAALRLGRIGEKAVPAIPFLVGLLGDTKSDVVQTSMGTIIVMAGQLASDALAKIGKPAIVPLSTALQDINPQVRFQAARALGIMKDPGAIEALIAALKNKDPEIRKVVVSRLEETTGEKFGEVQAQWRKWLTENRDRLFKKQ